MDRLQALLNGRQPKVKDPISVSKVSHATERARLNNEDRKYNKIVYDNSLRQANQYNQSAEPNTAKDIGVGFKINVYIIKLTQLLGNKGELDKILRNYFTKGVSIQKLRGTTKESQVASSFFQKGEILSTYNELMLYIKTYAGDIISDDSFKSQIFNSSFNPLTELLNDTAGLYPNFFDSLPKPSNAGTPAENTSERQIYEVARDQCMGCYSLFKTMADFINNLIFRPIVKEDVSRFIKDNRIKEIFKSNPMATSPLPPTRSPDTEPIQGDPFALPEPQTPAPAGLPKLDPNNADMINDIITKYSNSIQSYLLQEDAKNALDFSLQDFKPLIGKEKSAVLEKIKARIGEIITAKNIKKPKRKDAKAKWSADNPAGPAQPVSPVIQPVSPVIQPLPAPVSPQVGPAQAPKISALRQGDPDATPINEVWAILGPEYAGLVGQDKSDLRAVARDTLALIKIIENTRQRILTYKNPQDIADIIAQQPQQITNELQRIIPDQADRNKFYKKLLKSIRNVRINYSNQEAQDRGDDSLKNQQESLWGLGKERNNELVMNHILDFENLARRQARNGDLDTILELSPQLKGKENHIKAVIEKMRQERASEPNMWGKGKHENKQGIIQRASMLPHILEFEPKAEALKRGKIMSGGYYNNRFSNGMNNQEWNYAGYGEVMNEEDTPFKRMIGGMPNPFAPKIEDDKYTKFLPYNSAFDDEEDKEYFDSILPVEQGHYYELEKPVDLDEQADQIRKNNENYKVMTGKMKNVKYRN